MSIWTAAQCLPPAGHPQPCHLLGGEAGRGPPLSGGGAVAGRQEEPGWRPHGKWAWVGCHSGVLAGPLPALVSQNSDTGLLSPGTTAW